MSARVTLEQAAAILGRSKNTVRRLEKRGLLKRVSIDRRVEFLREDVERLDREGVCNSTPEPPETKKRASLREHWDTLTGLGRKKRKGSSK